MARVFINIDSEGRLIAQDAYTSSSAKVRITPTNPDRVHLRTTPDHVWDATDLIQLSQLALALAHNLQGAEEPTRFLDIGSFRVENVRS